VKDGRHIYTSRTGESHEVIDLAHLPTSRQPGQIGVTKALDERTMMNRSMIQGAALT
jgi:hypothetical protein